MNNLSGISKKIMTGSSTILDLIIISLASKYTIENKQFSGVLLEKVVEQFTEFLNVRRDQTIIYKIAGILLNEENLEESIRRLKEKDQALQDAGFKKSVHRVLGALSLENDIHSHAQRAKFLFRELKRNQWFFTSNEDIPYVICLTLDETYHPATQAKTVIQYYQQLKQQGFSAGNCLQALSFIMTVYDEEYHDMLLHYVVQLRKELEKNNIKIKKIHYPFLGILALAQTDSKIIEEITNLYNELLPQKPFRKMKEYALHVAIQKTLQNLPNVPEVISLSGFETLSFISDVVLYLDLSLNIFDFFH